MIIAHPADLAAATWIDLLAPTPDELARVQAATGVRVPSENEVSEIESSSRLAYADEAYRMSAPIITHGARDELGASSVGFVLNDKVLITVRFAAMPLFDDAHQKPGDSAEDAFLRLLEAVVDRSADELEHASAECDALSYRAFRRGDRKESGALLAALSHIGTVADHASHIRDTLLGVGRIADYVAQSNLTPRISQPRLAAIHTDVLSLTDYESHLANKIQFLLDATLGFINIEQNDIVKTLTIASVVGIPPVLIGGIYGMNFVHMPELQWKLGYPFALALMVITGLLPLVWFKRRGWM